IMASCLVELKSSSGRGAEHKAQQRRGCVKCTSQNELRPALCCSAGVRGPFLGKIRPGGEPHLPPPPPPAKNPHARAPPPELDEHQLRQAGGGDGPPQRVGVGAPPSALAGLLPVVQRLDRRRAQQFRVGWQRQERTVPGVSPQVRVPQYPPDVLAVRVLEDD